ARQRVGVVSTFHYLDNLSRAIRHAGRIMLDLIPKVYATPRVVRVLGPDGSGKAIPVNQPGQAAQAQAPAQGNGGGEQLKQIAKIYDLTAGTYDLTVRSGPSFTSRREEAATQMIELIRAYPPAAPIIGDLLARNLDWPGADEIAGRLAAMIPPQARGASPEAQAAQAQMGQMAQAAKAQMGQMAQALAAAKAQIETLKQDRAHEARKLQIEAFEAETNRLRALQR
ncbi:MAG: portal protein, partial [Phenylobacterium sp.]